MAKLTNRDLELLSWAVDGMTADEIAEKMGVTRNTVKERKSRIFRKMQVSNMSEATYKAIHQIAAWRRENGRPDESLASSPWL